MSGSARIEVDWSKTFHISVRKPQFWLISVCYLATRGLIMAKLEVDCSRNSHYIARKRSVTGDRQTTDRQRRFKSC